MRNGDQYCWGHKGRDRQSLEAVLESIHTNLFNIVGEAVTPVATIEKTWSQQEMVKRIVRYIYKAAQSPELLTLGWEELGKRLVDQAMGSYGAACQDKQWFYEIDLAQAFASVSWQLLCLNGRPRVRFGQIKELVQQEYEGCLEKILLIKTMWHATSLAFPEKKVQSKIYHALHKGYQGALEETMADARPVEELQRVEIFVRKWIDNSMRRAWSSVEAEGTLTDKNVLRLFQALVAPFGNDHPYSCIPHCLTENIGRPSQDWIFIKQVVKQIFDTWKVEAMSCGTGNSFRKRKRVSNVAPVADSEAPPEPVKFFAHNAPVKGSFSEVPISKSAKAEPFLKMEPSPAGSFDPEDSPERQHPDCTSADDCVGHWHHNLVRHDMIDVTQQGDVYCEGCWRSFFHENRKLQGTWEDGPLQGQKFDIQLTMPIDTA